MANRFNQISMAYRRYRKVVAFAVLVALIGGTSWFYRAQIATFFASPTVTYEVAEVATSTPVEASDPVRLRIPSVKIDAGFEGGMGLNEDQTIQVPKSYEELGWYKYAPKPGEMGPAVVLGHVDSFRGPAVLYKLGQTEVGDIVEIDRADGSIVKFEVTRLDRRSQSDFPTAEVYGDIDHAGLRIITCTGTYDHGSLRYSHNLIVYAKLVEEVPPPASTPQ